MQKSNLNKLYQIFTTMSSENPQDNLKQTILISVLVSFVTALVVGFVSGGAGSFAFPYWLKTEIGRLSEQPIIKEIVKPSAPEAAVQTQEELIVKVVKDASPSVVSVIATKDLPVVEQYFGEPFGGDEFFRQFFPEFQVPQYRQKGTEKKEIGSGTGFIVSSDGLIVTNKHVVSDTEAEYTVLTNDEKKYAANVLARDPVQDVAILKIEKTGLTPLRLGDSDKVQIGQTVITIGNALGEFRNTVGVGVVSGLSRSIVASGPGTPAESIEGVIQTDAAINPGNSGGPLLNLNGEVIGVNTAMVSGAQSIGFALPINKVKKDIEDVKQMGKIIYPFLGIRYVLITQQLKEKNNLLVDYGALVTRGETREELAVTPGSPADKAGILENDIILEIDGIKIDKERTLAKIIQDHKVGDEIALKILSKGAEKTVKVKLEERK